MKNSLTLSIENDSANNDAALEAIYAKAFGPGRFTKAAAVLRAGNACIYGLSRVVFAETNDGEKLIGGCRLWRIIDAQDNKAIFLGPIAIDGEYQGLGLGAQLMQEVLAACDASGQKLIMLVGDMSFFGQFGFEIVPENQISLPLPVAQNRLLWRKTGGDVVFNGRVCAPRATT
ncbi:MAG: GCN5-like N-acetyltransferase [Hyphomonadaceae bacterium]|nr:MAG: GCN5-like N-acetyltransferase [Hyphomonadaceae bacterium]KAF0184393.1 MAG: GCN5-like N-acetyltransferase [Hyphomonadaceae bacterium]